jgi:RNA polymerase sigma-70 factor (ECF subfamily)
VEEPVPADEEIIRRVVAGETDLFEQLIIRYRTHVARIVAGHVPRDLVEETAHDAFVRAYTSLPTYSFRQPFSHWLATIAIRTCYDVWRAVSARKEILIGGTEEDHRQWTEHLLAAESHEQFADLVRQRETTDLLQWALAQLSAENRMVVTLVHLEGYSVRDTAAMLGWTTVNVKVRAHRARHLLRKILEGVRRDSP